MAREKQISKCEVCANMLEVSYAGGTLVYCGVNDWTLVPAVQASKRLPQPNPKPLPTRKKLFK